MASGRTWGKRIGIALAVIVGLFVVLVAGAFAYLLYLKIPQSASGISAKAVCSGVFIAGRDPANLYDEDVVGASPALTVVSVSVDEANRTATAKTLGMFSRTAALIPERGCVLDVEPNPNAIPFQTSPPDPAPWPAGDGTVPQSEWPAGVDAAALNEVVANAFVGAGDIAAANARGVAVVQDGKLLVLREAPGFEDGTPLHGWSMTKSVAGMLAYAILKQNNVPLDTPVVDSFKPGRAPSWVADWKQDERAQITIEQVFQMTDGLANVEGYTPFDATVRMLNSEQDMAAFAASAPVEYPAGTHWNYTSQTANILAAVARGQFDTDEEYWAYPTVTLFDPLDTDGAVLETDTDGTWVGSSYLWASTADWAKFGQLGLDDGTWQGQQVLPPGWWEFASTPALPEGEGAGYSAQTWLPGNPIGGECRDTPGVPADVVSMQGHWGQKIAMVPSKNAVIVRLGWTFDSDQFDYCQFYGDVISTLPDSPAAAPAN